MGCSQLHKDHGISWPCWNALLASLQLGLGSGLVIYWQVFMANPTSGTLFKDCKPCFAINLSVFSYSYFFPVYHIAKQKGTSMLNLVYFYMNIRMNTLSSQILHFYTFLNVRFACTPTWQWLIFSTIYPLNTVSTERYGWSGHRSWFITAAYRWSHKHETSKRTWTCDLQYTVFKSTNL